MDVVISDNVCYNATVVTGASSGLVSKYFILINSGVNSDAHGVISNNVCTFDGEMVSQYGICYQMFIYIATNTAYDFRFQVSNCKMKMLTVSTTSVSAFAYLNGTTSSQPVFQFDSCTFETGDDGVTIAFIYLSSSQQNIIKISNSCILNGTATTACLIHRTSSVVDKIIAIGNNLSGSNANQIIKFSGTFMIPVDTATNSLVDNIMAIGNYTNTIS